MALRLETEQAWIALITEAGVPPEPATQYAKTFTENRLKASELPDFNMDLLKNLGITAIGDILSIIRHAKSQTEIKVEGAAPA